MHKFISKQVLSSDMGKMKLHPDWDLTQDGVLFNRFTMNRKSISNEEHEQLLSVIDDHQIDKPNLLTKFQNENIIVEKGDTDSRLPQFVQKSKNVDDVSINRIRFYVTERCNMGCPGCYVRFKYRNDDDFDNSDKKKAHKVVDFLREENKGETFDIHFLGGEPLIGLDLMKETISYAEETLDKTDFTTSVTTNATLVNEENAKYLNKKDVTIGVSFDGWKELNNQSRMYMNDEGTYDDAVEGFRTLKNHVDKGVGVLVTPQPKNIDVLSEVAEHLIQELDPDGLTINDPFHSNGEWEVDGHLFAEKLKEIIMMTGEKEIPLISPASQIIRAISHENPKIQTLPTSERNMTAALSTDGRITYHIMNFSTDLFPNNIEDQSEKLFESWAQLSGYQHEECRNCIALNTCSGPDPIESYHGNNNISNIELNVERCKFYKEMTEWLVDRLPMNSV